jgi:hypothetical protein
MGTTILDAAIDGEQIGARACRSLPRRADERCFSETVFLKWDYPILIRDADRLWK